MFDPDVKIVAFPCRISRKCYYLEFICPGEIKSCFHHTPKFWEMCSDQGSGVRGSSQSHCDSFGPSLLLILQPFHYFQHFSFIRWLFFLKVPLIFHLTYSNFRDLLFFCSVFQRIHNIDKVGFVWKLPSRSPSDPKSYIRLIFSEEQGLGCSSLVPGNRATVFNPITLGEDWV